MRLDDEVFDLKEAAAFIRVSPDYLDASDCPRAKLTRGGKRGRVVFLKSQLLLWVERHLTHRLDEGDRSPMRIPA